MCDYFSCVITRDLKVHWLKNTMGHEDILAQLKLEDKKLQERDFVRIEIIPKDKTNVTRNKEDWQLKIDEERTLPEWYAKNVIKAQQACWQAWEQSVQVNLILGEEQINVADDRFLLAYSKARIVAYGSVSIVAHDSVSIVAHDSVSIDASGSVSIKAHDYWCGKASLSSTATLIWNRKIYVHKGATVIQTEEIKAS